MNKLSPEKTGSERIRNAFQKRKALIGFLVAGDPSREKTIDYALALLENGVDILEIGIPFSDPVAEGEVIQRANTRALLAGVTLRDVFGVIAGIRKKSTSPLILLTYMNPILSFGIDEFFKQCREAGADGIILADLPFEEVHEIARQAADKAIAVITVVSPTSGERIPTITADAEGFVYVVSSLGVTGMREVITEDLSALTGRIRKSCRAPVAVGFGISNASQAALVAGSCDGVIIGSALVRLVEQHENHAGKPLSAFAREIRRALDS